MKKINLLALVATISLAFSSCSNDDSLITNDQNSSLLKTYKVKRDATGAYSLNVELSDNTKVDNIKDQTNNSNEYFLSSSNDQTQKNISDDLLIDNSTLKVAFVDTFTDKRHYLSITDDNITLQRKTGDTNSLKAYSIESNEDGGVNLDFNVGDNVKVSFVFNEEIKTYEIHLEEGKGGETSFSRTLEKEDGESLKIDFVNHSSNTSGKGSSESLIRKPKIIIDQGSID